MLPLQSDDWYWLYCKNCGNTLDVCDCPSEEEQEIEDDEEA